LNSKTVICMVQVQQTSASNHGGTNSGSSFFSAGE
jgi:hypothetical protein